MAHASKGAQTPIRESFAKRDLEQLPVMIE
jgi:hypothetical protein